MTYGITDEGFKVKRLAEIKSEIEDELRLVFGSGVDLSSNTVFGQFVGIYAEREASVWELAEAVYNSQYPKTSFKSQLDNVVTLTGITRQPGVKSNVALTFLGDVGTVIPSGSVFSVDGNSSSRFVLDQDVTIGAGQNEIQTITFSLVPDAGNFKIRYNGQDTGVLAHGATSQNVEDALNGLPDLSEVQVTGDFSGGFLITFQGADGLKEHELLTIVDNTLEQSSTAVTTAVTETQEGFPNRVIATVYGEEVGPTTAPSGTLTIIENPITGLNSVVNELDAIVGNDVESDSDLKVRREESLQRAGSSTLDAMVSRLSDLDDVTAVVGFENITMIEDSDGRPPKSFEMVVQGAHNQDIAETVWETKPGGIESHGSSIEQITDSQGFVRNIKFSRPTEVNIYVEIDLTTDSNFPINGLTQVRDAVVAHGDALGIGQDVIVYPKLLCALNDIQGITDVAIRIGTSVSPTTDDNVSIAPQEISAWDTSRTIITEV